MPTYVEVLRLVVTLRTADLRAAEADGSSSWIAHATGALEEARRLHELESRQRSGDDQGPSHRGISQRR